jgi:uncharacterized protein (DUF1697 family)
MKYAALLRGVNVGGKGTLAMADLRACLEAMGLSNVRTYINSGNVVFESAERDTSKLQDDIERAITKQFGFRVPVVVLSQPQLQAVIDSVPKNWEVKADWKYNLIFLMPPYDMAEVLAGVGELKPDIEEIVPGKDVLYQSMSRQLFGRTTTGKLASRPVYQQMTVRTTGTVRKLLAMMQQEV